MNLRGGGSKRRDHHGKGDRLVDRQTDGQHFSLLRACFDRHKALADELWSRIPAFAGDGEVPAVNVSHCAAINWL